MKISIITVCFNSEKTIEDTIKSVLSQEYNNVEYIRIQNGVNNPQATTATYTWTTPNLTLTEVMRGQLGTQPLDILAQDAILTFFNQIPQKTKLLIR